MVIASIHDSAILFTGTPSKARQQVCSRRATDYLASRGSRTIMSDINWNDLAWNVQGSAMQKTLRSRPDLHHFAFNLLFSKLWNNLFKFKASFGKYLKNYETLEDFLEDYPPP